ncbi:MAG: hypothetical protein DCF22_03495 [Leptolyngbya sp.]|nr:MAG: hypothetical protein DCF22_03495 [Leptolyngbya sp.]
MAIIRAIVLSQKKRTFSHQVNLVSTVRVVQFNLPASVDRHWVRGSPFKTHLFNSLHLTLPSVEYWMVRHVKSSLKNITASPLRQNVRGFILQEAQHAEQHAQVGEILRQQGYELKACLRMEDWILASLQRLDWRLNLAAIAGMEHLTVLLSEVVLASDLLEAAEPTLKAMLEWYALEEIEHKAVAYEVLQTVSQNYLLRVAGLAIGCAFVLGLLNRCTLTLLHQDRCLWRWAVWREMEQFWFTKEKMLLRSVPHCLWYLQPNFHPAAHD